MRTIGVEERRARLARRHLLAPVGDRLALDVVEAARALLGFHATDPASVFLSARARVAGLQVDDVVSAQYGEGRLVKHLAMRRTVFVLPADLLPVVQAACTDAIAAEQRRRLIADIEKAGVAADGGQWLETAERLTLDLLASLGEATGAELSAALPHLQTKLVYGEGRSWGGAQGVAGRVYVVLAAEGRIRRGRPRGGWTSSQHRWAIAPPALAADPPPLGEPDARAELVRRWLAAFGPATEADIAWWTGLGLTKVRQAVKRLGAVPVDLDGSTGLVLADDLDPEPAAGPWVALLPALDPTTMGWQRRDWYLGPHGPALFDRSGNAGPTVWADGRIVGGWVQLRNGEIVVELLEDLGAEQSAAVAAEAAALQTWLGGTVITPRFPTPLAARLRGER